jgi:hypothetical protein
MHYSLALARRRNNYVDNDLEHCFYIKLNAKGWEGRCRKTAS